MLSAPPSGLAHIAAHVGCCRWPPHPYNFPTLEKRVHRKRNGIAVANQQPLQLDESFEIGVSIYICIYIYTKKWHLHGESKFINHQIFRHPMFSQSPACSHPLAVTPLPNITAWWVPSCHSPSSGWSNTYWSTSKILHVDNCFSRIKYSILQNPSICQKTWAIS